MNLYHLESIIGAVALVVIISAALFGLAII